jgi:uncharacterized membrane protein
MDFYLAIKLAHVLGATILFGTGLGIAFFMVMAHRTHDAKLIAHTASVVVMADCLFTATAVVLQPITGFALADMAGYGLTEPWIVASLLLYVVTGAFWLPVVWMQMRLRRLAKAAVAASAGLPEDYYRLFRIWFVSGVPAFTAVIAIFALMIWKPSLW